MLDVVFIILGSFLQIINIDKSTAIANFFNCLSKTWYIIFKTKSYNLKTTSLNFDLDPSKCSKKIST